MAASGSTDRGRGVLRRLSDRLLAMTRILPGVGRSRPESFGVEGGGVSDRLPMSDETAERMHDQTHPDPTRMERGHPKR